MLFRMSPIALALLCSAQADAQHGSLAKDLEREISFREAELSALRLQLRSVQVVRTPTSPKAGSAPTATPAPSPTVQAMSTRLPLDTGIHLAWSRQLSHHATAASTVPTPATTTRTATTTTRTTTTTATTRRNEVREDIDLATALESSLVRQGGAVLSPGTIELDPELSYFYAEPNRGERRDAFGTALTLRVGLPAAMQAELYVPYVIRDHAHGVGKSSGIGDMRVGLTKELWREREGMPAILAFGRWRTTSGDINRNPPTGFGQHAVQAGLSLSKRNDPALLYASVSYTANLGAAHPHSGARIDAGNVFGFRAGAYLAATPETSFNLGISYNSSDADRFNDERVAQSDRARAVVELGSTTIIGRGQFLNFGIGIGVTPAAPKVSFTMSMPYRF